MTIRVWASPPVLVNGAYFAKAEQYCDGGHINIFPSNSDGTPASTWVITVGRSSNWTAASADAQLTDVFAGDLPSAVDTIPEFKALLRNTTISKLSVARRNAINTALNSLGVATSDFTGTTSMAKVFKRLASTCVEKDDNFGMSFSF